MSHFLKENSIYSPMTTTPPLSSPKQPMMVSDPPKSPKVTQQNHIWPKKPISLRKNDLFNTFLHFTPIMTSTRLTTNTNGFPDPENLHFDYLPNTFRHNGKKLSENGAKSSTWAKKVQVDFRRVTKILTPTYFSLIQLISPSKSLWEGRMTSETYAMRIGAKKLAKHALILTRKKLCHKKWLEMFLKNLTKWPCWYFSLCGWLLLKCFGKWFRRGLDSRVIVFIQVGESITG